MIYRNYLKRLFDIMVAVFTLFLLSPLMLLVALLIKLEDGGPIFFFQQRIGRMGEPFQFFKFRSMPVNTGDVPSAQAHSLPITRIGQWIRRTNVDELPQLVNVIKGEMSLVGPRPAIAGQTNLIKLRQSNGSIQCVPGLTGLAQVNAYNNMPEEEKAGWDGKYFRNLTFWNDFLIILRTVVYLIKPPPVY